MQFTIETRELTNGHTIHAAEPRNDRTTIEARTIDDAIIEFIQQNASELVSLAKPGDGRESIATIKKADCVYLVRVYEA